MEPHVRSVLESAQYIASKSISVVIDKDGVDAAAEKLLPELLKSSGGNSTNNSPDPLEPPNLTDTDLLEWIFLLDTLNFCFWSDEAFLFTVDYKGTSWTGYKSLCAALCKAKVDHGLPVHKPSFYRAITIEQMNKIFKSDSHVQLPLLQNRMENLHEAAQVLYQQFGGSVVELVQRSGKSSKELVKLLAENFSSYHDCSIYKDQPVCFLKRAQIFAADVWCRFSRVGFGEFHDINCLTMFADYRVPQSLLYLGVLKYSKDLMKQLMAGVHLVAGCEEELEIRGCSVWAVELVKHKLMALIEDMAVTSIDLWEWSQRELNSVNLDYFLWRYAKSNAKDMEGHPIHRTLTIFY